MSSTRINIRVPYTWDGFSQLEIKRGKRIYLIDVPTGTRKGDILTVNLSGPRTVRDNFHHLGPSSVESPRHDASTKFSTSTSSYSFPKYSTGGSFSSSYSSSTPSKCTPTKTASNVPKSTQFDPEFGEEDENALRELLIQRCLELLKNQQKQKTVKLDQVRNYIKNIVCQEFGAQRYERYKTFVEYFINKRIVDGDEQERQRLRQEVEESKYGISSDGNSGTGTFSKSKGSRNVSSLLAAAASATNSTTSGKSKDAEIELPRLVACVSNCGYWGTPKTKNLCNKCYQNLVTEDAKHITNKEAIQHMLSSLGFNNIDEYRLDLAFKKRFPNEVKGEQTRNELPGVKQWFNTARPLTQFDKAPERGTTACTYISGVTAIRALARKEYAADPAEWADCILRGVTAYHAAARSNTELKGYSHISEALPYVMEVLGNRPSDASKFKVKEKIVLLYKDVNSLDGSLPSECFGSEYVDEIGKKGLIPTLRKILQDSTALVITRPPETWSVTLDQKTSIVRMRDSHRKQQFDFDDVNSFLSWVSVDRAFFASVPSSGIDFNSVSITWFVEKTEDELVLEKGKSKEEKGIKEIKGGKISKNAPEPKNEDSQEFIFLDHPPLASFTSLPVDHDEAWAWCQDGSGSVRGNVHSSGLTGEHNSGWTGSIDAEKDEDGKSNKKQQQHQDEEITRPSTAPTTSATGDIPIEVVSRVYISGYNVAKNKATLLKYGITHILNCTPSQCKSSHLKSDSRFTYGYTRIYRHISNTTTFRGDAANFISDALLLSTRNRVLIYCESGISVSPTIVMAWMMDRKNKTLSSAYSTVIKSKPDACPSDKMFDALLILEKELYDFNTMDKDQRSTDIILNGILNGFNVKREKVLKYVTDYGVENAQRKLLSELMST